MMRIPTIALAAFALAMPGAAAADERPQLSGVSTVRVANYGTPSTVIQDRERLNAIVAELRQLRGKAWRRGDTKLSCYATLALLKGDKTMTLFRIGAEAVVERPSGKGQSIHSLAVGPGDMPVIGPLLAGIPPPKDCN
jgi:hypothetical protein